MSEQNNTFKPRKIILDTNILSLIYGSFGQETPKSRKSNKSKLCMNFLHLSQSGIVKFYITPQIYKEFLNCKGKNLYSIEKFNTFMQRHVTLIKFNKADMQKVVNLTYDLGNMKVHLTKNHKKNDPKVHLFDEAEKPGCRNFADCTIMAEAMISEMDLITENMKDFSKHKFVNKLYKKYGIQKPHSVYKARQYIDKHFEEFKERKMAVNVPRQSALFNPTPEQKNLKNMHYRKDSNQQGRIQD